MGVMAVDVKNWDIRMTRGDSDSITLLKVVKSDAPTTPALFIDDGSDRIASHIRQRGYSVVPFEPMDRVRFTVRHRLPGHAQWHSPWLSRVLLQKTCAPNRDGSMSICIYPRNTGRIPPGIYVYDIQLTYADGGVTTLTDLKPPKFILCDEVTIP